MSKACLESLSTFHTFACASSKCLGEPVLFAADISISSEPSLLDSYILQKGRKSHSVTVKNRTLLNY